MQQPNGLSQTVRRFIITALILTTGHTMAASIGGKLELEGGCETVNAKDIATPFVKVPMISVWGDNSKGAWGVNGDKRRDGCLQAVNMINQGGGRATFMLLPEHGIAGNSHMMMMDKNNLQVADAIQKWILQNATK